MNLQLSLIHHCVHTCRRAPACSQSRISPRKYYARPHSDEHFRSRRVRQSSECERERERERERLVSSSHLYRERSACVLPRDLSRSFYSRPSHIPSFVSCFLPRPLSNRVLPLFLTSCESTNALFAYHTRELIRGSSGTARRNVIPPLNSR